MCPVCVPRPGEFLNIANVLFVSRNEFGSSTITVLPVNDSGSMIAKLLNEFADTGTFNLLKVQTCERSHVFAHPFNPHAPELARIIAQAALFL